MQTIHKIPLRFCGELNRLDFAFPLQTRSHRWAVRFQNNVILQLCAVRFECIEGAFRSSDSPAVQLQPSKESEKMHSLAGGYD